jgi:hypothetical protein
MLAAAQSNPLSLAFTLEALALMAVLAYLLPKWGVTQLSWGWFVVLSLVGSLAVSLPIAFCGAGRTINARRDVRELLAPARSPRAVASALEPANPL